MSASGISIGSPLGQTACYRARGLGDKDAGSWQNFLHLGSKHEENETIIYKGVFQIWTLY